MVLILTSAFLLFLQAFRESSGGLFDSFFMTCTDFGDIKIILFLIGALYWCYDKKLGEYLFVSLTFTRLATIFTKITACINRPWIVDSNIHPYNEVSKLATGYSFPSGHASSSTILFIGTFLKKNNISKGLKIFSIISLILICFSRCYFGVHSLLDIIFGVILSLIVLFITKKLFDKLEEKPNFDLIIASVGIILSILLLIYATFKSYPIDYDTTGKLLIDPAKTAINRFKDLGFCSGILISWVIERRYVKFSSDGPLDYRILRLISAYLGYLVILNILSPLIKSYFVVQIANFINYFILPCYIILIVPMIIKFFQNRKKEIYTDKNIN